MSVKEGDKLGRFCPKCKTELYFELGFEDRGQAGDHYTVDVPLAVCEKCGYSEDYVSKEEERMIKAEEEYYQKAGRNEYYKNI